MYLGIFVNTSLLLLIASTKIVHEHAPYHLTSKCTKRISAKDKSVVTLWTVWKPAVRGCINLLHRFGEASSHPSWKQKLQRPISQHWVKTYQLWFQLLNHTRDVTYGTGHVTKYVTMSLLSMSSSISVDIQKSGAAHQYGKHPVALICFC